MPKLFIGPYKTGLERDVEPWLLPEEAFPTIEDAYVWRGRVKKKPGYSFLGRLHLAPKLLPEVMGITPGGGTTFVGNLNFTPVSPGTVTITIGAFHTLTDNGNGTLSSATGTAVYGTIDYESGAVVLFIDPGVGPAVNITATEYRWLPRLSAMGLGLYERPAINREELIAFDENYSYLYNTATGIFDVLQDGAGDDQVWNGTNSDFFWTTNYYQDDTSNYLFWTTNNIANSVAAGQTQDGIQIYDGTNWTAQTPLTLVATELRGCLMLIPYRNRMVALNTLEGAAAPAGATRFQNRARWSQNGVPYTTVLGGFNVDAWREDIVGRGGYIDCPTSEAIVSAAFVKDTLIVFFERSTWELRYTGNELLPFIWFQVNSELGAESTFSSVPFDKGIFTVGDKGIITSNALNVERIDQKIPDEVYNFHNDNTGPARVHGIRDHFNQLVYWCFPNDDPNEIFPDKVLCLNYEEGSYSIFNDSFTCFGTWQSTEDYTWETLPYATWEAWDLAWGAAAAQSYFPNIVAGNQKGFVLTLNQGMENGISLDFTNTLPVPSISNTSPAICNVINHNLKTGQFVKLSNIRGFALNIVNEALGTADIGNIGFTATLAFDGLIPSTLSVTDGVNTFTDLGNGTLSPAAGITGTIEYETGTVSLTFPAPLAAPLNLTATYSYNILNNQVFYVQYISPNTFSIFTIAPITDGTLPVDLTAFAIYAGSGQVAVMNNMNILTKRFSPFLKEGQRFRMSLFEMFTDTNDGNFTINIYGDQNSSDPLDILDGSSEDNGGKPSGKNWKHVYPNVTSSFVQMQFTLSKFQMTQQENYTSDFVLHALNLDVQPTGRL